MIFSIHPDGPAPLYEQIAAQVIYAVAVGTLEPSTFIPSVRELAEQLRVHPNTVARAFQELERAGVVRPRRGRGMEVLGQARAACKLKRQEMVRRRIRQAMREAADSAMPQAEVRKLVEEELAALTGKGQQRETVNGKRD